MQYLTSLNVCAVLNYPPKRIADKAAPDSVTRKVYRVCLNLKDGHVQPFANFMEKNYKLMPDEIKRALEGRTLVPMPRADATANAPIESWSTTKLARAVAEGLELEVATPLVRSSAVGRNSQAAKEGRERTTVLEHIESLHVASALPKGPITLVDDIVSSGATFIGAANALFSVGATDVMGFAAGFTVGGEVEHFADPHECEISWPHPHGKASRRRKP